MKKAFLLGFIGICVVLGAGCSKATKIAKNNDSNANPSKEALIQRRVTEPPTPPANIPLPTPVNTVEVIK